MVVYFGLWLFDILIDFILICLPYTLKIFSPKKLLDKFFTSIIGISFINQMRQYLLAIYYTSGNIGGKLRDCPINEIS